jgi:AcrR family transcriptional regulator
MSSSSTAGRTGRRGGENTTREAIAAAARAQFAEHGFERATFRSIAAAAGVDPALVVHFYGAKDELFRAVMDMPAEVSAAFAALADGPRETVGRRLAELVVAALERPLTRSIVIGRIRCASSHADAAALVRETVLRDVGQLTRALGGDRPDERAVLVGSQVVGVALARYVVCVEPIASLEPERLVELLAPGFQLALTGPLDA